MSQEEPVTSLGEVAALFERCGIDMPALRVLAQRGQEVIYGLDVPGSEALTYWERLRALTDDTGFWPVIGWDEHKASSPRNPWIGARFQAGSTKAIIEAGACLDLNAWFKQEGIDQISEDLKIIWPDVEGHVPFAFTAHLDIRTDEPLPWVVIALVPTRIGWEVPAILRHFSPNEGPRPEEHVALHKYWNERYRAEIVSMTHDTIEMRVLRPPSTYEAAAQLAREQSVYCPDLPYEEIGSFQELVQLLLNSPVWYFWWD